MEDLMPPATTHRRRGRPTLEPGVKLDHTLGVPFDRATVEQLDDIAYQEKITRSELVRRFMRACLNETQERVA
jgi:hypothetical protein